MQAQGTGIQLKSNDPLHFSNGAHQPARGESMRQRAPRRKADARSGVSRQRVLVERAVSHKLRVQVKVVAVRRSSCGRVLRAVAPTR